MIAAAALGANLVSQVYKKLSGGQGDFAAVAGQQQAPTPATPANLTSGAARRVADVGSMLLGAQEARRA